MKNRMKMVRLAFLSTIAGALALASSSAGALLIQIDGVVINDNAAGDLNPAAGIIGFRTVLPGAGFGATGQVSEVIIPGMFAGVTVTDLVIGHTGFGGQVNNIIFFQSSLFPMIGPLAVATAHLDGRYVTVGPAGERPAGGIIDNADIQFTGSVNAGVIVGGVINPPGAAGVAANVLFNPANQGALFNFGVTSLEGALEFQVSNNVAAGNDGIADGIVLPGSASVSLMRYGTPEPGSLALLAAGALALARSRRRNCGVGVTDDGGGRERRVPVGGRRGKSWVRKVVTRRLQ